MLLHRSRRAKVTRGLWAGVVVLAISGAAAWGYWRFHRPPASRLGPGQTYADAPESEHLHYLDLPLDRSSSGAATFRAFYVLSPQFKAGGPVTFLLTDGQMELDDPHPPFERFDEELPGQSYVIIGHRGHAPTLFPEVYPEGRRDLRLAMRLYGSWQQVDDIEAVRQDMEKRGLLPPDGKVQLFGASGAGILVQQYLHRYPQNVSRALLVSTGAPDAWRFGAAYARDYSELEPEAERLFADAVRHGASRAGLAYVVFQLGREGVEGLAKAREVLRAAAAGNMGPLRKARLQVRNNLDLVELMLRGPSSDAVKVRMFELLGRDLRLPAGELPGSFPLYAWSRGTLGEFLSSDIEPPPLEVDRHRFQGEVLVIAGLEDVVFSPVVAEAFAREYPSSRFVAVHGGHRLEVDRALQSRLRRAFLEHGLHSRELDEVLAPR